MYFFSNSPVLCRFTNVVLPTPPSPTRTHFHERLDPNGKPAGAGTEAAPVEGALIAGAPNEKLGASEEDGVLAGDKENDPDGL
jgi:hypothetical protein